VLPKDKQEVVFVLQQRGYVVGMTGDGVNDGKRYDHYGR
jgi:P-type E1-E2 ATPase